MSKIFERKAMTSGITLIALVITIVVIMILAGVSVAMLTGDNAIIEQASDAKRDSEIAGIKEQIENEVLRSYGENGYIDKDKLDGRLNAIGVVLDKNSSPLIASKGDYLFTIDEDGVVSIIGEEGTLAGEITAVNYGDYIDYPIDLNDDGDTTNDWRIFYNEKGNTFIIAADYLKNDSSYLNNTATEMVRSYTYGLWWDVVETAQPVESSILSLFKQSWTDYSTNINGRCVSTLLNISNWSGFVDSTYADYAIGCSTLEMWVASYNAKGYDNLYCNNTNTYGYYVGNRDIPTTIDYDITDDSNNGYNDTLYFPYQTQDMSDGTKCGGYWLASPSAEDDTSLIEVGYNGFVRKISHNATTSCVRPIVSLRSEVTASQDESGVWRLSN